MEIIYSHNQSRTSRAISFLKPSWVEVFFYIVLALACLLVYNRSLFNKIFLEGLTLQDSATLLVNQKVISIDLLEKVSDVSQMLGVIFVFVFWMLVGGAIYSIIWLVEHATEDIQEDVEGSTAIAPESYKKQYWQSVRAKYLAFVAIILSTIGLVSIFLILILPIMAAQIIDLTLSPRDPMAYLNAVIAVILTAIGLYLCFRLTRVLRYITTVVIVRN